MRAIALAACIAALTACTTTPPRHDLVVLLPQESGKTGAVIVRENGRETVLDKPYSSAQSSEAGTMQAAKSSPDEVSKVFGAALSAQPARPVSLTLYFDEGTTTLSPESKAVVDRMFSEIATRPAAEITVIGHTDSVGNDAYNDKLSLERAERVRQMLIGLGVPAQNITAAGRGKRDMVVPTAENVSEPRNRRVEISVR